MARILIGSFLLSDELESSFNFWILIFGPFSQFSSIVVNWTIRFFVFELCSIEERRFLFLNLRALLLGKKSFSFLNLPALFLEEKWFFFYISISKLCFLGEKHFCISIWGFTQLERDVFDEILLLSLRFLLIVWLCNLNKIFDRLRKLLFLIEWVQYLWSFDFCHKWEVATFPYWGFSHCRNESFFFCYCFPSKEILKTLVWHFHS